MDACNNDVSASRDSISATSSPAVTWHQVAHAVDRVAFLAVSLWIVVSTALLFPYLAISGSQHVDKAQGQMECMSFDDE